MEDARLEPETSGLSREPLTELSVHKKQTAAGADIGSEDGGNCFVRQRAAAVEKSDFAAAHHITQNAAHSSEQSEKLGPTMINRRLMKGVANRRPNHHRTGQ
jgi:hypothetical protein